MNLVVNGKKSDFPKDICVSELLRELEVSPKLIAVERNGVVVRKQEFDSTFLEESDRVEIVQFVGGG